MTIANAMALVAANTAFEAKGAEIFGGAAQSVYREFAEVRPHRGQFFTLTGIGATGEVEKINGSRRYNALRAYANTVNVDRYGPPAYRLPLMQVTQDLTGDVERALMGYLAQNADFFDAPVTSFLLSNPKGIDGVALLSDSHPFAPNGGTWDNLTSDALDATSFAAGVAAMAGFEYETGKNAGYRPTALMVGPTLRQMAFNLAGSPIVGTTDGSSIPNWIQQGEIKVIVNPHFTGTHANDWMLLDLSPGKARPIVVAEVMAPVATAATSPDSQAMIDRSEAVYLIEAWAALAGCNPYAVYGKLS